MQIRLKIEQMFSSIADENSNFDRTRRSLTKISNFLEIEVIVKKNIPEKIIMLLVLLVRASNEPLQMVAFALKRFAIDLKKKR